MAAAMLQTVFGFDVGLLDGRVSLARHVDVLFVRWRYRAARVVTPRTQNCVS